jgi:hypothetical protein
MRQSPVVRVLALVGSSLLALLVLVQKVGVVLAVVRECDRGVEVVAVNPSF